MVKIMKGESIERKAVRKKPVRKSPKNDMREKKIERNIILGLRLRGYECGKTGESSTYNSDLILDGKGDIEVITYRGLVYLEVKVGANKQRSTQRVFEEICIKYGIEYYVVKSLNESLGVLR